MLQVVGPIFTGPPFTKTRVTDAIATQDAGGVVNNPARFTCHAALFQAIYSNTGKIFIGREDMEVVGLVGIAAVLAIPTTTSIPAFGISLTLAPAGVDLSDLYIMGENEGEGVFLTVLVT